VSQKLQQTPSIWKLASDLGLRPKTDPLAAIVKLCVDKVSTFLSEFQCTTLSELLNAAAAKLDTLFIEIRSDGDLLAVKRRFLNRREIAFVDLEDQFGPDVFAITFRLICPAKGDRQFVSIIDCRGEKAWRSYFSKWHEIAHLLTLTPQLRFKFCRTHSIADQKDPEEAAMDVIAGAVGFLPEMVRYGARGEISFEKIEALRSELCADSSLQASLIGFTKAWSKAAVLIQAGLGLRRHELMAASQGSFGFRDEPGQVLRAVGVTFNDAARENGLVVHRNMRIPLESVIHKVFSYQGSFLVADENLAWWQASSGPGLPERAVFVQARRFGNEVYALISLDR
jgi:hypothetical protein